MGLQSRSRELLGGDFAVSSRRWPSPTELEAVRGELRRLGSLRETEVLEFFSMVGPPSQAPQLVELVTVEDAYPLVGSLERETSGCPLGSPGCLWGDAPLAIRWNLKPGESLLRVGKSTLRWGGRILRDTSRGVRGTSFAPRVFLPRSLLADTGLLRAGATLTVRHLFAIEPPPSAEALAGVAAALDQKQIGRAHV